MQVFFRTTAAIELQMRLPSGRLVTFYKDVSVPVGDDLDIEVCRQRPNVLRECAVDGSAVVLGAVRKAAEPEAPEPSPQVAGGGQLPPGSGQGSSGEGSTPTGAPKPQRRKRKKKSGQQPEQ